MGDVERDLTELYRTQYPALVRLATRWVWEHNAAEDAVHSAFVQVFRRRRTLRVGASMPAYLRVCVINQARSVLRRQQVAQRYQHLLTTQGREQDQTDTVLNRAVLRDALAALPRRQCEAIVLRYYADLSEREAADVMGVGIGTVKSSCSRGVATLSRLLRDKRPA
ncbi:sigma-70 family RNA polymerase sigma factor [Solihabitans fulvus]|uniref:Sigma-70 family RNA polymerase sigma factor n=1 Tax=Solihabitans fulvus TaxID=1892852 RepID=A0A5B2XI25_9PSEU|nr:sigma-70 family RNA polymerase sigma factor [Solihabitans fulvus]KAA2262844.1 sigma-70 family RNA polymerase sigma factor [Solihabitans fulvus]